MSTSRVVVIFTFCVFTFFSRLVVAQRVPSVNDSKSISDKIQSRSLSKNLSLLATEEDTDVYDKIVQLGMTPSPIVVDYFKMAVLDPRTREIYVNLNQKSEADVEGILSSQFRESFKSYQQKWESSLEKNKQFDDQVTVHGLRCLLFLTEEFCEFSTFDKLAMEWYVWHREMKGNEKYRSIGPGNLFLYNLYVEKFASKENHDEFPIRRMFAATLATITKERFKDVYESTAFEPVGFKITRWYRHSETLQADQKDTSPPFICIDHQAMGTLIFMEEPIAKEAIHSVRSVLDGSLVQSGSSIESLKKWLKENPLGKK